MLASSSNGWISSRVLPPTASQRPIDVPHFSPRQLLLSPVNFSLCLRFGCLCFAPGLRFQSFNFSCRIPMDVAETARHEEIKREWTDQFVQVNPVHSELKRFEGITGRVVTVNWSNKPIVDFQDGAWYDITAS